MRAKSGIDLKIEDGVARIILCRTDGPNSIDLNFSNALNSAARKCAADKSVRAVLLVAEGSFFCVGANLKEKIKEEDRAEIGANSLAALNSAVVSLARMHAPVIAAVQGPAAGGGVSLVAAADIVLAAPEATFHPAFMGISISPDSGSSYFLPRRMGSRKALEFLLMNEGISADEAEKCGLITRVVPADSLMQQAEDLAHRLALGPPLAIEAAKNLLLDSLSSTLEQQLSAEARIHAKVIQSSDLKEAVAAFAEKRKPTFAGR